MRHPDSARNQSPAEPPAPADTSTEGRASTRGDGEPSRPPRPIERVEDRGRQETVEDLAGEPMREHRDKRPTHAAAGDIPDDLEALGDMPIGEEDDETPAEKR